ncbi:MAG: Gfo/Idh/MocA family protein [Candidatus Jordarchaeum sp.]|uniref:Gfo/Idh/MocA family protein n=1 Tax=Candidatus Jordarchaeum sp. TaxID=2823881 RepID=UPI00404B0B72
MIGMGRWGRNHLKTLTNLVDELYVVDSDPNQLRVCEEFSISGDNLSTHYIDFLDFVDGVDIVTPADSHLAISKDCFKKGKDVFVEKPIALTSQEAKEMISMAEEKGLILQIGHIYRYHSAVSKIKCLLKEGKLGAIRYAYGHFMGFKRPRMDVGVTQTDAIHFFDLFNYIFDELPQAVTSVVRNYLGLSLDDTSISILEYGEKIVILEAGYMPPEQRRDIAIIGDQGSIYCDFQKNLLQFYENRHEREGRQLIAMKGDVSNISIDLEEPLSIELRAFLDSIRDRIKPLADGQAGYNALKIVEACYESSRKGERIEIKWE